MIMSGNEIFGIIQRPYPWCKCEKNGMYQSQARSCQYECIYKFGENQSICSRDIEQKQNFAKNQGYNYGINV